MNMRASSNSQSCCCCELYTYLLIAVHEGQSNKTCCSDKCMPSPHSHESCCATEHLLCSHLDSNLPNSPGLSGKYLMNFQEAHVNSRLWLRKML